MTTEQQRRDAATTLRELAWRAEAGDLVAESPDERATVAEWRGAAVALEESARPR